MQDAAGSMAKDITGTADVRALVLEFYAKVKQDALLAPFFADLDWGHHIPRINAFWAMVLLGERSYQGDPMTIHMHLHERMPLTQAHFDRWVELFCTTVGEHFRGAKASEAMERARSIAAVMAHRVLGGRAN